MRKKGFRYVSVANIIGNMTFCSHENLISTPQINTAHPYQWVDYITGTKEGIENVLAEWSKVILQVSHIFPLILQMQLPTKLAAEQVLSMGWGYKSLEGYSKLSYTQQNIYTSMTDEPWTGIHNYKQVPWQK